MRRVLVLGGTGWLGRAIAREAVAGGAEVTCLARGASGDVPAGARLVRADRTRPGAYDELRGEWDEVIELADEPALVRPALDALADRARHWTLVSSVSVYRRDDEPGADESAELVEPRDLAEYPDAKVAAERASAERVAGRLLVARPGLIVGPGDPSDRFGYWAARLHRGGRVLTPTTAGRRVQVVDVDDLAAWVVRAGGAATTGTVNAVGASRSFDDLLDVVRAVTGFTGTLVPAEDDWLTGHGVGYWAGPRSLPLWLPASASGFAQRSGARYRAAGGRERDLAATVERVLRDEVDRGTGRVRRSGLAAADEADLLAALA